MRLAMRYRVVCAVLVASVVALAPDFALARRVHASIGRQTNGNAQVCFNFSTLSPGVTRVPADDTLPECLQQHFVLPILWDTASDPGVQRTIRIYARRGSANLAPNCTATVVSPDGTMASSGSASITSTSYTPIDI